MPGLFRLNPRVMVSGGCPLDKDQFERWCSKLSNAKRPFKFVKPDGQ
jgi:hypothetical protein